MKENLIQKLKRHFKGKACRVCGKKFFNRGRHMKKHKDGAIRMMDMIYPTVDDTAPGAAGKEGEKQ